MWWSEPISLVVSFAVDHPGLKEASPGGVGTGVNYMTLSPINGMASRVCILYLD